MEQLCIPVKHMYKNICVLCLQEHKLNITQMFIKVVISLYNINKSSNRGNYYAYKNINESHRSNIEQNKSDPNTYTQKVWFHLY